MKITSSVQSCLMLNLANITLSDDIEICCKTMLHIGGGRVYFWNLSQVRNCSPFIHGSVGINRDEGGREGVSHTEEDRRRK